MMRIVLAVQPDFEWRVIAPLLSNEPRGVSVIGGC